VLNFVVVCMSFKDGDFHIGIFQKRMVLILVLQVSFVCIFYVSEDWSQKLKTSVYTKTYVMTENVKFAFLLKTRMTLIFVF